MSSRRKESAEVLVDAYVTHLMSAQPRAVANAKSVLRKVLRALGGEVTVQEFIAEHEELLDRLQGCTDFANPNSYRVIRSRVRGMVNWAYAAGWVRPTPSEAEKLGLPSPDQFLAWRPTQHGRCAYNSLIRHMLSKGWTVRDLNAESIFSFLQSLRAEMTYWQQGWGQFRGRWNDLASAGAVPSFVIPEPPTKRPPPIALPIGTLPTSLQAELKMVEGRLRGDRIEERRGRRPYAMTTISQALDTVRRVLGFLHTIDGADLTAVGLRTALSLDVLRRYVEYTNRRAEVNQPIDGSTVSPIGEYQLTIMRNLSPVVLVGLRDTSLHEEYSRFIARLQSRGVESRREIHKDPGAIDDYFRIAHVLAVRAQALAKDPRERAAYILLLRDSLLIALYATFVTRRSIGVGLEITKHVKSTGISLPLLCISKEETKPGRRDLQLELPMELTGLWTRYLSDPRPVLISKWLAAGNVDHGAVFVGRGGRPLSPSSAYSILRKRSREVLGVEHNPHQVRKCWCTEWYGWSAGDFLTAAAVMDASPQTQMRYYAAHKKANPHPLFDRRLVELWESPDGGGGVSAGNAQ